MTINGYRDYGYAGADACHMHALIVPQLMRFAEQVAPGARVLDVGCGNGFVCGRFLERGCNVVGVDLSQQGIKQARSSYPQGRFEVLPADEQLLQNLGEAPFDLVISTEVVEHLYSPRDYVRGCYDALLPGGRFLCSTPYHGYLKNLAIALAGKWDTHANPLWDGGHIKLWSRRTLSALLREAGFENLRFQGLGRFPGLWKTMVICSDKPARGAA